MSRRVRCVGSIKSDLREEKPQNIGNSAHFAKQSVKHGLAKQTMLETSASNVRPGAFIQAFPSQIIGLHADNRS